MRIVYKKIEGHLAATVQLTVKQRTEIQEELGKLAQEIPSARIAGPPFCIFNFITSVTEGFDVTLGFPLTQEMKNSLFKTHIVPEMEVLSIVHRESPEKLRETIGAVFSHANQYAIISDEFYREVYLSESDPDGPVTEIQFVIHNWNAKLAGGLARVLGESACQVIMQGSEELTIESDVNARFQWVKDMLERLDDQTSEFQKFDILSSCAHVFPKVQIAKLKTVFDETKANTQDAIQAVDAVLDFMVADAGWGDKRPLREGYIIYTSKNPRDPNKHEAAKDDLERRKAYCYCPLVRDHIDQGMPVDFCYCGSGWFRQQLEGAISKPVTLEVIKSVLKGDDVCQFAIHLPEDI